MRTTHRPRLIHNATVPLGNLYWDTSGSELALYARNQWTDDEIDPREVVQSIDGDVPAADRHELAQAVLERFEE